MFVLEVQTSSGWLLVAYTWCVSRSEAVRKFDSTADLRAITARQSGWRATKLPGTKAPAARLVA